MPGTHTGAVVTVPAGIHKIRHVIIITQENRSFDSYFGTYPGADGILMRNGRPAVCVPDPRSGGCQRPYHDRALVNGGGPHGPRAAEKDIGRAGRMKGFLRPAEQGPPGCLHSFGPLYPLCSLSKLHPDVMGYHTGAEIPNYWAYARHFVLQDHMFAPNLGWSLPAHLYGVSAWSARCRNPSPMSCTSALGIRPKGRTPFTARPRSPFRWTDLTYLLHRAHISWRYYVHAGRLPDCASGAVECHLPVLAAKTPGIWNPLPRFTTVRKDHQLGDIQGVRRFFTAAHTGALPAVAWIVPDEKHSEHPPASIAVGQAWVTHIINAVMQSSDWNSTAIFLTWDDWAASTTTYAHPSSTTTATGCASPALSSARTPAKATSTIKLSASTPTSKFIEDDFLGGQRLNPKTDGRPDFPTHRPRKRSHPRQPRPRLQLPPTPTTTLHPPTTPANSITLTSG